jgi:hypothetical protein
MANGTLIVEVRCRVSLIDRGKPSTHRRGLNTVSVSPFGGLRLALRELANALDKNRYIKLLGGGKPSGI